jgi:hypothetical protein
MEDNKLEMEVQSFYDITCKSVAANNFWYSLREEDPQKKGTYPERLVAILNCYTRRSVNPNKLGYGPVREDCRIFVNHYNTTRNKVAPLAELGHLGSLAATPILALNGNTSSAIITGISTVGLYFLAKWARVEEDPEGLENLKEFEELFMGAGIADLGVSGR